MKANRPVSEPRWIVWFPESPAQASDEAASGPEQSAGGLVPARVIPLREPNLAFRLPPVAESEPGRPLDDLPDTTEPNNEPDDAVPVTLAESRQRFPREGATRIDATDPQASQPDKDWFELQAVQGQRLFVSADTGRWGSSLSAGLELYRPGDPNPFLVASSGDSENDPIRWLEIDRDGPYHLCVLAKYGQPESRGPYRCYAQLLPPNVRVWRPDRPQHANSRGNPVDRVAFCAGGTHLYTSQFYNALTVLEAASGLPVFSQPGGGICTTVVEITTGIGSGSVMVLALNLDNCVFADGSYYVDASREGPLVVGVRGYNSLDETWLYDGERWTEVPAPAKGDPSRRWGSGLAYDAAQREFVLFGGAASGHAVTGYPGVFGYADDTWIRKDGEWRPVSTSRQPTPRCEAAMAYFPGGSKVLLVGGYQRYKMWPWWARDAWEWKDNTWTPIAGPNIPSGSDPPLVYPLLAYDARRARMILVDGYFRTWEYDGSQWYGPHQPSGLPASTGPVALCYDSERGETVLVAHDSNASTLQTWSWGGDGWSLVNTAPLVGGEGVLSLYFDERPGRKALVMVCYSTSSLGPPVFLLEWDGQRWTERSSLDAPFSRYRTASAYDPDQQRLLMFGGMTICSRHQTRVLEVRRHPQEPPLYERAYYPPQTLRGIAVSPDGSRFAAVAHDGSRYRISLHDPAGNVLDSAVVDRFSEPLALTRNGESLLLMEHDERTYQLAVYNWRLQRECFREDGYRGAAALSSDGRHLAFLRCPNVEFFAWGDSTAAYERQWAWAPAEGSRDTWFGLALAGDGSRIFGVGCRMDEAAQNLGLVFSLWDAATGRQLWLHFEPRDPAMRLFNAVAAMAINADGSLAVAGLTGGNRDQNEVLVFGVDQPAPIFQLGVPGSVRSLDICGRRIAVGTKGVHEGIGGGGGEVYLIDLSTAQAKS